MRGDARREAGQYLRDGGGGGGTARQMSRTEGVLRHKHKFTGSTIAQEIPGELYLWYGVWCLWGCQKQLAKVQKVTSHSAVEARSVWSSIKVLCLFYLPLASVTNESLIFLSVVTTTSSEVRTIAI